MRISLLESLQFIAYAAATGLAAATSWRLWRTGRRNLGALFFLLACCCLFAAGEEISWGQRVLGLRTPEEVAAVNGQEELNVHEVVEVQGKVNLGLALASLYGLTGHELAKFSEWPETCFALALALFALLAWRRVDAGQ